MDEITVQVGGHVTLLFSIHSDSILPRNQGSKGVGLCLEHGVQSTVSISDKDEIEISTVIEKPVSYNSELYSDLLNSFRDLFNIDSNVRIELCLELPISQGFGMSAAGLLSTSLALGQLFDKGDEGQLARLAHRIERKHSSGLGDILGLWAGGCGLRTFPGSPPYPGKVSSFSVGSPALLVWDLDSSKHTSHYINDKVWKQSITLAGDACVNRLKRQNWGVNIWPSLLNEADNFANFSGLLSEPEREKLYTTVKEMMEENMSSHLCMLGTSLIIVPKEIGSQIDFSSLATSLNSLGYGTVQTFIQ